MPALTRRRDSEANQETWLGLGGLLRERSAVLSGILNGIDTSVWNPQGDPHIAAAFSANALEARGANKLALQRRVGLPPQPDVPLLGVISRLSPQKGLDLLLENVDTILAQGMQLALLGSGDHELETRFAAAAKSHQGRIGVVLGYDEPLAPLIQAGCDALAVPSRFEPCGLTQLCALRYGAVPIVARVGGLEDTIVDVDDAARAGLVATGFKFARDGGQSRWRLAQGPHIVRGQARLAKAAAERHGNRRLLAPPRQSLCRALP